VSELDAELAELFRDESTQRLDEMDAALLSVESGGAEPGTVNELFRNAHTIKGAAGILGYDDIRALAHAVEDVLAAVRETGVLPPGLAAPLLRATAALRAQVLGNGGPGGGSGLLAELARARAGLEQGNGSGGAPPTAASAVSPAEGTAAATLAEGTAAGTLAGDAPAHDAPDTEPAGVPATDPAGVPAADPAGVPAAGPVPAGSAEQDTLAAGTASPGPAGPPAPRPGGDSRTVRVPAGKIDHLLDLVGEVMQDRRRLTHSLLKEAVIPPEVADRLDTGERMLDELKDSAVSMRLLPLAAITGPLPRAVRDLARSAGKQVEFTVTGADTEIDRVILEGLAEPLTHLLRNAIIHGIEAPQDRQRAGKPPSGCIKLRAVPRGGLVEIAVSDDGRGVSPEVLEQARGEGSLTGLLARPGYSTAAQVTDLAGRGVGLDAVNSHVQSVRGSLEVHSDPGAGMEVVLLLPLALALLDVLLFERGEAVFGVPLASVEEVVIAPRTLVLEGKPALDIRGKPLPISDLATLIGAPAPPQGARPPGLIIGTGGQRVIVTCDELLGEAEVAVKPFGPLLAAARGYLGAAILGDGRIALLLEPAALVRAHRHATAGRAGGAAPAGRGTAPKILVVEDSFTVRELQRSILEAAGYRVVTARDGREGKEVLSRDGDVALVLSDLEMPGMDGLELTRAIRADPARSSLPVVIVTSRGSEEDRRAGVGAGADAYMAKQDFDQQALLATVERLVGR
jgi:two-component system, chemotaxis family, sensor kinase CheA